MRNQMLFSIFLLCIGSIGLANAGKPWPRIDAVVVKASATVNKGNFAYSYTLSNPKSNKYPLHRYELDLRLNPQDHPLGRQDLTISHTAFEHMDMLEKAEKINITLVRSPDGWGLEYTGLWGVDGLNNKYMIQPGSTLPGFGFSCALPIGIREFAVAADSWHFFSHPEEYEFSGRELKREGDPDEFTTEVNKGIQFLGKTIAPIVPPEPFSAGSWTARMEAEAVEARVIGWIKTEKQLFEINKLIAGLKTDDLTQLKGAVGKINKYVLSEKKKGSLTDEADALIRLNAQYLLRRLEKPEENKLQSGI